MAQPGDVIENPITGERVVFRRTASESGGELSQFDVLLQPQAAGPPQHVHPGTQETFEVVSGRVRFRTHGQERIVGVGERVAVPPGTPHAFWNGGNGEAHVLVEARPPFRLEMFLETVYGLARDGKTNKMGIPNPLQMAVIAHEFSDVAYLARPPLPVQTVIFGLLAPLGRLLGYRPWYPKYSTDRPG